MDDTRGSGTLCQGDGALSRAWTAKADQGGDQLTIDLLDLRIRALSDDAVDVTVTLTDNHTKRLIVRPGEVTRAVFTIVADANRTTIATNKSRS